MTSQGGKDKESAARLAACSDATGQAAAAVNARDSAHRRRAVGLDEFLLRLELVARRPAARLEHVGELVARVDADVALRDAQPGRHVFLLAAHDRIAAAVLVRGLLQPAELRRFDALAAVVRVPVAALAVL